MSSSIIIIFQFASFYRFEDGLKNNKSPVTSQQENIHFIINYYVMRSCMYVDMECNVMYVCMCVMYVCNVMGCMYVCHVSM